MAGSLLNLRMHDGSRHFGGLPQSRSWYAVRDHVASLPGTSLIGFITDTVTEAWIDFTFAGHHFAMNNQFGEYWFFVDDPSCPEHVLRTVLAHFEYLLEPAL